MKKIIAGLLLGLFTHTVLAEEILPPPPKSCRSPDGMARFTLECLKLTNEGLHNCYQVAARIYCTPADSKAASDVTAPTGQPAAKP